MGRGEGSSYTVRVIADHRGNTMELGATSLPLPNTTQTRVATKILRKFWDLLMGEYIQVAELRRKPEGAMEGGNKNK